MYNVDGSMRRTYDEITSQYGSGGVNSILFLKISHTFIHKFGCSLPGLYFWGYPG